MPPPPDNTPPAPQPPSAYPPGAYPPVSYPPVAIPAPPNQTPPGYPAGASAPGAYPTPGYPAAPMVPPAAGPYQPVPTSPGGAPLAEWVDRLLARLIDGLIVGAASAVLILPVYFCVLFTVLPTTTTLNDEVVSGPDVGSLLLTFAALFVAVFAISFGIQYVYDVEYLIRNDGQTVGKRVMRIRVLPVDPAQPLTRRIALIRLAATFGLNLVSGLGLVDGLFPLWDKPFRQTLHDKAAKTLVIKL